jgi:Icc-related predicted phosphoesterase
MKIVFISDTHGKHDELQLPKGDLLIHAGDVSPRGTLPQMQAFLDWFEKQPFKYKVFIAGNHDFIAERNPVLFESLIPINCIYLKNSGIAIEGIHIWGSPITPWFYDWAFNRHRGKPIAKYWDMIPENTDILVTHGPPFGVLDETVTGFKVGCEELGKKLKDLKVKIHVFGHIHEAYGVKKVGETTFINASVLDINYKLSHKPVVQEI